MLSALVFPRARLSRQILACFFLLICVDLAGSSCFDRGLVELRYTQTREKHLQNGRFSNKGKTGAPCALQTTTVTNS